MNHFQNEAQALRIAIARLEHEFSIAPYVWLVRHEEMAALRKELCWTERLEKIERRASLESLERRYTIDKPMKAEIPAWTIPLVLVIGFFVGGWKCYHWWVM